MKRMKQIISLLLCLCMVFPQMSLMVSAVDIYDEGSCGEKVSWVLYSDGVLSITGSGEIEDAPWYQYNNIIKKVVINSGVTLISEHAFEFCSQLVSVELPNTMESIGEYAFQQCHALNEINIPQGVDYIGQCAFFVCESLESVKIPSSLVSLEQYVFGYCTSLKCVEIPDSISHINEGTFYNCSSLADVYYGGTNEQWENMDISDNNDGLSTATIHYNLTENDCEHSFSYYTTTGTTAYDAQTHTSHSWTIEKCSLCQETRVSNHTTEKNEHLFENDSTTCSYCRYTSVDCKHEGKILIDHARQINDSSDKTLHNIYEYKRHTCALCQSSIQFDVITYEYAPHDFNSNGYCTVCKYSLVEGCYHDTYNMPVVWTYEEISGNDEWHIRHQQSSEATCKTCKQVIDIFRNSEVLEEHIYENGVCTSCNHVEGSVTPTYTPTISDFALSATEVPLEQSFTLSGTVNGNGDTIQALQISVFKKGDHSQGGVHQRVEPSTETYDLSNISPIITGQTYGSMLMNEGEYDIVLYVTLTNGGSFGDIPPTQTVTVIPKSECAHVAGETSTYVGSVCRAVDDNNHEVYADKYSSVCTKCNEPFEALIPRENSAIEILPHDYSGKDGICKSEGCAHACSHANMTPCLDEPVEGSGIWKDNGNGTHARIKVTYVERCTCGVEGDGYVVENDIIAQPHTYGEIQADHYETNEDTHKVVGTKVCTAPGCGYSEVAESEWENHDFNPEIEWGEYVIEDDFHLREGKTSCLACKHEKTIYDEGDHVDNDQDGYCDYCRTIIGKQFNFKDDVWGFNNFNVDDVHKGCGLITAHSALSMNLSPSDKAILELKLLANTVQKAAHCYGMAATAIINKLEMFDIDFYTSAKNIKEANRAEQKTSSFIDFYHASQHFRAARAEDQRFLKLSVKEQLIEIAAKAKNVARGGTPCILSWGLYNNPLDQNQLTAGHAVVAYGVESGHFISSVTGNTYDRRILIYDSNGGGEFMDNACLLFNEGTDQWEIPAYVNKYGTIYSYGKTRLTGCVNDISIISATTTTPLTGYNAEFVLSGSKNINMENLETQGMWTISPTSGSVMGPEELTYYFETNIMNDEVNTPPIHVILPNEDVPYAFYSTEGSQEMKMYILYDKTLLMLDSESIEKAMFDPSGVLSIWGNNGPYKLTIVDDAMTGDDPHTFEVSGSNKGSTRIALTDNGLKITGDNLNDITVLSTSDKGTDKQIIQNGGTEIIVSGKEDEDNRFDPIVNPNGPVNKPFYSHNEDDSNKDQNDYFDTVINKIKAAKAGDIIKVNAGSNDRIPVALINALRKKNDVTLVIRRNKGDNITLYSEMNFKDTKLSYYPIYYLETMDNDMISSSTIEKENPETGAF